VSTAATTGVMRRLYGWHTLALPAPLRPDVPKSCKLLAAQTARCAANFSHPSNMRFAGWQPNVVFTEHGQIVHGVRSLSPRLPCIGR